MTERPAKRLYALIAAGGTGGHIFPGVAIAEELRAREPQARIAFAGTERGLETKILPRLGWPLKLFASRSIKDQRGILRLIAWARVPFSVLRALLAMAADRPGILISIGGYAAGPLCVAAWALRVPVALVEPNAIPGMTNRLLSRFARRVFVAFLEAERRFPAGKALLTGVPIRRQVLETRRAEPSKEKATVFVFGGSQGARRLNQAMVAALPGLEALRTRLRIVHQTGEADDRAAIEAAYAQAGFEAEAFAFTERIWECFARADVVVSRSGANAVAELAALGIPSILVPYPYAADDHQRANAESLARAGAAEVIPDAQCDGPRLAQALSAMLNDPVKLTAMRVAAASAGRPGAAMRIAEECLALARP